MKVKILMVCLGNICRSPIAEGILKSKLNSNNFFIDSAGTGSWHVGNKPDLRSIAVSKAHHIDISNQNARQFTYEDYKNFDHIYVMDQSNKNNVLSLAIAIIHRNSLSKQSNVRKLDQKFTFTNYALCGSRYNVANRIH